MSNQVRSYRAAVVLLTAALVATLSVALTGGDRADALDGPVDLVYVATGRNFPDALAGATLATTVGAPLLTVEPDLPLPATTITALQSLDPDRIIVLGGPVAVSDAVVGALTGYARSGSVTRIQGDDRHHTAALIADALPGTLHDADLLDGLDSTAFLRANAAIDADTITGLGASQLSSIVGSRDDAFPRGTVGASDYAVLREVSFNAPTSGFISVVGKSFVSNATGNPGTPTLFLLLDWDGGAITNILDLAPHTVDIGAVSLVNGAEATLTVLGASQVTAGDHTAALLLLAEEGFEWNGDSLTVTFSPNGTAPPAGWQAP